MDLTPVVPEGRQYIEGYGPGMFRISGLVYGGPVIVMPERTVAWDVTAPEQVTADALAPVASARPRPEVLLLGTGARMALLPRAVRDALRAAGIVPDPMATDAACRTFNVLMAEDRRVAAALIPLPV